MQRLLLLLTLAVLVLLSCRKEEPPPVTAGPGTGLGPAEFLLNSRQDGKIQVVLLGMQSCATTRAHSRELSKLAPTLGESVVVGRIDVPPPKSFLQPVERFPHGYYYGFDENREIADALEFFYYPTLYIIDADGEIRYSGGLEEAELGEMLAEIEAEQPGDEKACFLPPTPEVGAQAPEITGKNLEGVPQDIGYGDGSGPVVLFFTSVTCPFSSQALEGLPDTLLDFEVDDYTLLVVEKEPDLAEDLYETAGIEGIVLNDADGKLREAFGVEPVPFFFVVGEDGQVAARGPYTESRLIEALGQALGIDVDTEGRGDSGAG